MIEKRYQFFCREGKSWTRWFKYSDDNSLLEKYQKEEKWQMKNKLLNEYRIAENKENEENN